MTIKNINNQLSGAYKERSMKHQRRT
uniref:Uncharacterized protein n=1 Tax=Rhizophora mucronata TaxID=61149 RepID=A0A2P2QE85_RHIMU